jgi:RNA polymerase-interacting CarD/CdnL/TRCF family regulator
VILTTGNKVIYPSQGPCLIGAIVQKVVDNRVMSFRELLVLCSGGKLFIPIENIATVGVRPLLKKTEIPKLLDRLKQPPTSDDDWKERARENSKLLASGSALALADVVGSLTVLSERRSLTAGDHRTLERARTLLICEIAEVTGETRTAVEQQIDDTLKARKGETVPQIKRGRPPVGTRSADRYRQAPEQPEQPPISQSPASESAHASPKIKLRWSWGSRKG